MDGAAGGLDTAAGAFCPQAERSGSANTRQIKRAINVATRELPFQSVGEHDRRSKLQAA